jgi:hypothetical protein
MDRRHEGARRGGGAGHPPRAGGGTIHDTLAEPARRAGAPADPIGRQYTGAIERSLQRAERSAAHGEFGDALGWLELVRALDGRLEPAWEARRRQWERSNQGGGDSGLH